MTFNKEDFEIYKNRLSKIIQDIDSLQFHFEKYFIDIQDLENKIQKIKKNKFHGQIQCMAVDEFGNRCFRIGRSSSLYYGDQKKNNSQLESTIPALCRQHVNALKEKNVFYRFP